MTVVSLVLIVVAVVLLGYGLFDGSNTYLVASILTSLVAALALVVGSRRGGRAAVAAAVEAEEARVRRQSRRDELVGAGVGGRDGGYDRMADEDDGYDEAQARGNRETALIDVGHRGVPAQAPSGDPYDDHDHDDDIDVDDDDPSDEPPAQRVAPADAAVVAQLDTEVLVIDGRPRYHLAGCVHLLGRENEGLPVGEAVELGFTPCGLCEPDSTLAARARRA